MRACISLAVAADVLVLGGVCPAQLPTAPAIHSMFLSVNVTATGGAAKASGAATSGAGGGNLGGGWAVVGDYGQTRVQHSGISLTVQARNLRPTPDKATLEWYFVAWKVGLGSKGKNYIFESDSKEIELGAASSMDFFLKSRPLEIITAKEMHTSAVNPITGQGGGTTAMKSRGGDSVAGWIIRLMIDGKPVQIRASSAALEAVARNEAQLNAFPR